MQAELDRRTATQQARMDQLPLAQQSVDSLLRRFEEQLNQVQAANRARRNNSGKNSVSSGTLTMRPWRTSIARLPAWTSGAAEHK
jgi:hypothetical protein